MSSERKAVSYSVTVNAAELFTGVTGLGASSRRNPTEVTITRPTQLEAVADAVVVLLSTVPRDSITDVLTAVRDAGLSLFVLDSPKQTAALEELYGVITRDNQPKENPSDDGRG
jgi:predicted dinucleotide-binding enzyme